jgi:hypothetical protein
MPIHSFGVFGPQAIAEMTEILDAAFEELQETVEFAQRRRLVADDLR